MKDDIDRARFLLEKAGRVFVMTGAGVSAESGVATFRDSGGLWKQIDPMKVATPEAFEADPRFVWEWYDKRRTQLKDCSPNPGHYAVAAMEKAKDDGFFLLTQNVDDLHERAGSLRLAHIHGKIYEVQCLQEGVIREDRRAPLPELPPRCPNCGAMERPNVVWFGEQIDQNAVLATESFLSQGEVDVVFVIGTEASFGYIIDWAQRARHPKGALIEVNPGRTTLTPYADLHLQGKSGEILPLLTQNL
ncbi:MAG: NAD-dependent deacylase [Candidatus Omnitrophica bacterium]|nr:NAD-dependent deacylase [Candidatus Omnitrophota bacterium]